MKKISILLAFLVFLSRHANAAIACVETGNSLTIVECLQSKYEKHDRELIQAYQVVLKGLVPQGKDDTADYASVRKHLAQAQQHWRRFMAEECKGLYRLAEEGTGRNAVELGCYIRHMKQRIQELRNWGEE